MDDVAKESVPEHNDSSKRPFSFDDRSGPNGLTDSDKNKVGWRFLPVAEEMIHQLNLDEIFQNPENTFSLEESHTTERTNLVLTVQRPDADYATKIVLKPPKNNLPYPENWKREGGVFDFGELEVIQEIPQADEMKSKAKPSISVHFQQSNTDVVPASLSVYASSVQAGSERLGPLAYEASGQAITFPPGSFRGDGDRTFSRENIERKLGFGKDELHPYFGDRSVLSFIEEGAVLSPNEQFWIPRYLGTTNEIGNTP